MRRLCVLLISTAVLWASSLCVTAGETDAPQVSFFSPQGTIKGVRQVAVRFSSAMVTFGDPRLPDPFAIECPEAGHGRWADVHNWVFDFDHDLPAGVRCQFKLKPELKAVDGEALTGQSEFSFDTGGPGIRDSLPYDGAEDIDERQVFVLALDTAADPASVHEHAHCRVDGISELIDVDVLTGAEREEVLAQKKLLGYSYFRLLWKSGRESVAQVENETFKRAEQELVLLRCQRALPPATGLQLVWDAGIKSVSGVATQQAQTRAFRTRPAFTVRFECDRVNEHSGCIPALPMRVRFSTPVPAELAAKVTLESDDGTSFEPEAASDKKSPTVEQLSFSGPFPELGKFRIGLPDDLVDDAGRKAENAERFPLQVRTDEAPPLAKFASNFGIIESKAGAILPVSLRNLESTIDAHKVREEIQGKQLEAGDTDASIARWMRAVDKGMEPRGEGGRDKDGKFTWKEQTGSDPVLAGLGTAESFSLPKSLGGKPFEVVGIPLKDPGFYVVELASPKLGKALLGEDRPRYVATAALVTNMAVHFKWGREASLVWVTTLDGAKPVADAAIRISEYCTGREVWTGTTGADGSVHIDGTALPENQTYDECTSYWPSPLMVSARTADDMSFTLSSWGRGIQPYNFNLPVGYSDETRMAHTVFDRTLLRAGETVSMKHFLRRRVMSGIDIPEDAAAFTQAVIEHEGSDQSYELPLTWDDQGTAESNWTIPQDAKLGTYRVSLDGGSDYPFQTGSFRVEQYRVPTMTAVIQPPAKPLVNAADAQIDVYVSYLSGGGAANLPAKLRTLIEPKSVEFRDYADYQFGGKDVVEGLHQGPDEGYDDEGYDEFAYFRARFGGYQQGGGTQAKPAQVIPVTLDEKGAARLTIPDLPKAREPQQVRAELEYQDANGELLTATSVIPLWPSAVNLGIRTEGWAASKDHLRLRVVALDVDGKPVPDREVSVDLFENNTYSYRKRLIGGFYAYEHSRETKRIDESCTGKTNEQGLLICDLEPGVSGQVIVRARASDELGNPALASKQTWLVGADDWWFDVNDTDRMDLLPEQNEYEAGSVARFQVRMPFRSATALVTVEREGVIDSFVTELSGREPVVEVPIKPGYSPNVYVSVLAVRGRVGWLQTWLATIVHKLDLPWQIDGGIPTGLVDLSKPAYRLGMAQINVGWKPHRLDVAVDPDAKVYRVRDMAKVKIKVSRADGGALPGHAEVAIAAVDEGLLELKPNDSWALLERMMGKRNIDVFTSTAQMQVVGKRHYGRKAVPHGGGGGRRSARELFDTLLLWKGRVLLDANGLAEVEIPLNDSLTSFRIVAVASAGSDLFGTGQASISTTQDLMLHSGLPLLVREGDRFDAIFTVRNASERKIALTANAHLAHPGRPDEDLPAQALTLVPGQAADVVWKVTVPVDVTEMAWDVSAVEQGGDAKDKFHVKQQVIAAYPVRTYQATLTQISDPFSMQAERPGDAVPGRGGINVALRAKLGDGLDGIREYMSFYPYSCYEQRISQAVALQNPDTWNAVMNSIGSYLDGDGLLKYFPGDWLQGSDTLTSYVLAIANEAGWKIPQGARDNMLRGLNGFVEGRIVRDSALPTADLSIRKLAAVEALTRYEEVSPHLLDTITVEPNLWPTSAVLDWVNVLKRVSAIDGRDRKLAEAQQIIRSRLNFQGTTMGFSTEHGDALWWLMISGDLNSVRGVLSLLDQRAWRDDMPRLMRGALGRQLRGHWDTTVANAWGVLALQKFSAAFESEPVTGHTATAFAGTEKDLKWAANNVQPAFELPWPDGPATLSINHDGGGRPWAIIQSRAAIPLREPLFTGYQIKRTVTPVEQKQTGTWNRGDVARIRLDIDAQSDMTWVVVDDPIPAGASILGTGLGRDSKILTQDEKREGWVWPAYEERRAEAFRAYYVFVPKGTWTVEYTVRYNNPGVFALPSTRVEAMYAPEMFGEMPNDPITIPGAP